MKLTFRSLAIQSALVFFSLALTWMFAPNLMLSRWSVDFSYSVGLMARRGAQNASCFRALRLNLVSLIERPLHLPAFPSDGLRSPSNRNM
jgi:hypothetical protein